MRTAAVLAIACALVGCDRVWGLADLPHADATIRPDGEPVGCPANYDTILPTTASRYRLVLDRVKWIVAADDCANDAPGLTHLLVLSNAAEHASLRTEPPSFLVDDLFIGATDVLTKTNDYRWVTSEVTNYAVPI
ncbi:MAG TPA: C-type lectin domain-containing protein, partial [Kofleriaceae bacterium]